MKKILFTLLLLAAIFPAFSQVNLELSLIENATGEPLAGLEVTLSNQETAFLSVKTSNQQGKIRFAGVPVSGTYVIFFAGSEDFLPASISGIEFRSNENPGIQLSLSRKAEFETAEVEIRAFNSTKLNTVNAEVSSGLTAKEIELLPVEGRDLSRALYRLPNVSQATGFYPEAPNVSINGANSLFTNYLIDGMDNNERFLGGQKFAVPTGFARNLTVLTNNFSAEYGLTTNGVVNVTSKSGGNNFGGEAFLLTRPGPVIDGSSPYPQRDLSGNLVKDGFQRYQAGFGVGGALVPNKTFYFVNAEQTIDLKDNLLNSPKLNVNETVRGLNRFTYLSAKVDHNWSARFRSSLRVNKGVVNIERQGGGLEGGLGFPSAANSQDRNSLLIASRNSYVNEKFLMETNFQFSRFRWNYGKAANPESPNVTLLDPAEETIALLGHPGYIFDETENTLQIQQKFNFYLGNHTLKAGVEIISADHSLYGGGNVNGSYLVKLTAPQLSDLVTAGHGASLDVNDLPSDAEVLAYNVELRPASFGTRQNIVSLYVEDQFSVSQRLNLSMGLRYDYDNLSKGGSDQADMNNLAPRLSANYKLNSRSSVRAGYGMFYDRILYAVYSDALQQNNTSADFRAQLQELKDQGILPAESDLDLITFDGNLTGSFSNVDYLMGPSSGSLGDQRETIFSNERRILNPNGYQNPYTHQFSLGFQHQLNENALFYVDLVHNRSYNLFRVRDLNTPEAWPIDPANVEIRSQADADASRPVAILSDAKGSFAVAGGDTLRGIARSVVVSETEGKARYWAASFNLQKEKGVDDFAWRLIYTLSFLENNTDDINFRAQDSNDFEAEWGPSLNDRRHILNGIFSWYPFKGFSLTLAALLQSGQPINRIPDATVYGTTDLNGDGRAFGDAYVGNSDREPGESRNSDRLPWSNSFDLGLKYRLLTTGTSSLEFSADVFNLFNAVNLSGYSNNATQSNQIQAGPAASGLLVRRNAGPPRQFQFGMRFLF